MTFATGVGSWPGDSVTAALQAVAGELTSVPEGVDPLPYLPELPARGAGADLVGRAAGLLVDLPVDLQPQGWRLTDHPGRDAARTAGWWRQDLDTLAEQLQGWTGMVKVQAAGPWTLASELWLPLGDRVLSDPGATREVAESLTEGLVEHLKTVQRLLPQASLVVQLDEPSLPAVLAGSIPSDSGYRRLRAVEPGTAEAALRRAVEALAPHAAGGTVVHCCATVPPWSVLRGSGASAVSVDVTRIGPRGWESVAVLVESGTALYAGMLPTAGDVADPAAAVAALVRGWREVGLPLAALAAVTVTPTCGLAGASPEQALALTRHTVTAAERLMEAAAG